jgi:nucleoside 2-deoxyribosyltransferase
MMRQCPVCKLDNQNSAERDYGDKVTYDCSRCGRYTITGSAEAVVERESTQSKLSGWLREENLWDKEIPMLTSSFLEEVVKTLPNYSPLEKQNKLLKAIERLTKYPGGEVVIVPIDDVSLAWAENEKEFVYYMKSLVERRLLEIPNKDESHRTVSDSVYPIVITATGWEHLDKARSDLASKTQAFVAMSFDEDLMPVYENAIVPAIESTGYRPYRVDSKPHLDRIDTKIIAEIRDSRFLVADVTQQKAGVYYEAGFAYGLGIPVIWCVNYDDRKNLHFDTRQFNHIIWKTEEDLKEQLRTFILATIGAKKPSTGH